MRTLIAKCVCIDPETGSPGPRGWEAGPWEPRGILGGLSGDTVAGGAAEHRRYLSLTFPIGEVQMWRRFAVGLPGRLFQRMHLQLREVRLLAQDHTAWGWGPATRCADAKAFLHPGPSQPAAGTGGQLGTPSPPAGRGRWPFKSLVLARPRVIDRNLGNTIRLYGLGTAAWRGAAPGLQASCKRLPRRALGLGLGPDAGGFPGAGGPVFPGGTKGWMTGAPILYVWKLGRTEGCAVVQPHILSASCEGSVNPIVTI